VEIIPWPAVGTLRTALPGYFFCIAYADLAGVTGSSSVVVHKMGWRVFAPCLTICSAAVCAYPEQAARWYAQTGPPIWLRAINFFHWGLNSAKEVKLRGPTSAHIIASVASFLGGCAGSKSGFFEHTRRGRPNT